jgi:hypothetical protein
MKVTETGIFLHLLYPSWMDWAFPFLIIIVNGNDVFSGALLRYCGDRSGC